MKAKKSLGQNFLRDPKILRKIADFAEIKGDETVLEIGPGEGTLTEELLARSFKLIAVEKDHELYEKLKNKFSKEITNGKLVILNEDILNYKLGAISYKLIGNIPYYITGEIFRKFLSAKGGPASGGENQPSSLTFVIQREVAERILARDGKESVLSISVKAYGEPRYGGIIKAGSFSPSPKVDSAIIAVRNLNKERFKEGKIEEKGFFQILKKGFGHKRKLLAKNLGVSPEFLEKLGIPTKARAENLSVEDWFKLAAIL